MELHVFAYATGRFPFQSAPRSTQLPGASTHRPRIDAHAHVAKDDREVEQHDTQSM